MADYIDREEIYRRWNAMPAPASVASLSAAIQQTPAADVAPVRHGRWILIETDEEQLFFCSECENKEYWESDFCPSCGAKMDGGDKNDE